MHQRRRHFLLVSLLIALLGLAPVAFAAFSNGSGNGKVRFKVKGPAGMLIKGKGKRVRVDESDGKVTVTSSLNGLKTGMSLRDKHLKKYLGVKDHPEAVLVVERSELSIPEKGKKTKGSAIGKLSLNGVTKDTKISYVAQANKRGNAFKVTGKMRLDIEDFDIEQPCYLGVCVEKTVKVTVRFKVKDK